MGCVEWLSVVQLQVGGQGEHEEAIYLRDGKLRFFFRIVACAAERAELFYRRGRGPHVPVHVDAQAQVAEQKQRLLGTDQMGVLQQRHRSGDLIVENVCLVGEQLRPGGVFVLDYFGDNRVLELRDDVRIRDAERDLVGQLVQITGRFGSFAEETANRKAHVLGGVEKFLYLARHLQSGQMEHYRDPYSGAQVGGAGGKIPVTRAEGELDFLLYHVVDAVYLLGTE